jgi:predicted CoA-substrate-specific enzyme activase
MQRASNPKATLYVGIDAGAESIKMVVCEVASNGTLEPVSRELREHHKEPQRILEEMLDQVDWDTVAGAAATGRLSRLLNLTRIPVKQAQIAGFRHHHPDLDTGTVVSIGAHGFSVLEIRDADVQVFRENSRCSQGTGNFLRQLVERFNLNLEEAATLCEDVPDPAPLSGRCPVILKTDMTHLANKGEGRERILAGLYDAVCENVQVLIKPKLAPAEVVLIGGVARARRVRKQFGAYLRQNHMHLVDGDLDEALYLEALGCATLAMRPDTPTAAADALFAPPQEVRLDRIPALATSLDRVHRMKPLPPPAANGTLRDLVLGFDIGSTGSKVLAIDRATREIIWETYVNTNGNPVGAAKQLMQQYVDSPARKHTLRAVGVTGSGREIVGSLLSTCYGPENVYVLNEIAAHAEGAMHYDDQVDTIFEIGGQDAKYIRLSEGRVVDAAMNEACSAGTGSFIEEQGRRFSGIRDVVQLGETALTADHCISLGQHCSVFMAEVIDEAVAADAPQNATIAGIYDSIIQNYLNRVKGSRDVGQRIFCQGMPFSSDALAAAVARQTGSDVIIPPNPGTVGALGIALLTTRSLALPVGLGESLTPEQFLETEVVSKDTFVCKSAKGCGGAGNKCRIDRLTTLVMGQKKRFLWGGSCSRYDKGTHKTKLPDLSPDPFRERNELVAVLTERTTTRRGRPTLGLTDEFTLKSLFPFFATYLYELGFDLVIHGGADQAVLKRGIEEANVPFCAPMQQYHGLISGLAEAQPDYLFLPMLRSLPRVRDEKVTVTCPIVQGSPDVMRLDLGPDLGATIISPVIDIGEGNLGGTLFEESCRKLAQELAQNLGAKNPDAQKLNWREAFDTARREQDRFDERCFDLGREALAFCEAHGVTPIIVLGRAYTIYNTVLNSNVPALVREQGALPIPVDCYPVDDDMPLFEDLYWGYAQRSLRAAHQIRRRPQQYSIYCSNYSCGPDSFNLHFYSYAMAGRPFAIIETDGHSGDAGTKTRIEAFLHCVKEDLAATTGTASGITAPKPPQDFRKVEQAKSSIQQIRDNDETLLFPRMGPGAELASACFRGLGYKSECLPMADADSLAMGRRETSGKECVPMTITTGSLLKRLSQSQDPDERFCFFMPTANGPCRFGVYNALHKIILERLGYSDRVSVFSASDEDYFAEVPSGVQLLLFGGFMAEDLILEAFYYARPAETAPGVAEAIYEQYHAELAELIQSQSAIDGNLSMANSLKEVATGKLFGIQRLIRRAAKEFAANMDLDLELPTVLIVGEIYVRCDPFANGFVIDKLEERGVRARFAPFNEWLEYVDFITHKRTQSGVDAATKHPALAHATTFVQNTIQSMTYDMMAGPLGWAKRTTVQDSIKAAEPYIRKDLNGEAVLTLGGPTYEHREGHIQGVVSVGPLECMPNKLSETQFFHVAEKEGLLSLTLQLNGEPFDIEILENFVFEVKERFREQQAAGKTHGRRMPLPGLLSPQQWVDPAAEIAGVIGSAAGALGSAAGALGTALLQFGVGGKLPTDSNPLPPVGPRHRTPNAPKITIPDWRTRNRNRPS